jgi:hypothetical protein
LELKGLNGLTTLTLNLGGGSNVSSLDALKELKGLTTLTLNLLGSSVTSLDALKELKGLTTLTFMFSNSDLSSWISPMPLLVSSMRTRSTFH